MLPTSIENNRVHPLGEAATRLANTEGIGNHEAADRITLDSTPVSILPKWLQPSAKKAAAAREAEQQARADEVAALAEYNHYISLAADLHKLRQDIDAGEQRFAQAKADIASFPDAFALWTSNTWGQVCDRVNSTLIAEKLVSVFPGWIAKAKADAARLSAEVDKLARKYQS